MLQVRIIRGRVECWSCLLWLLWLEWKGLDFEVEVTVSNRDVVDLDVDAEYSFFLGWNHDRVEFWLFANVGIRCQCCCWWLSSQFNWWWIMRTILTYTLFISWWCSMEKLILIHSITGSLRIKIIYLTIWKTGTPALYFVYNQSTYSQFEYSHSEYYERLT